VRGFSYSKQLHELFEGNLLLELEGPCADILEMLWRDEVADSFEYALKSFSVDPPIDGMEVEHLHKGLPLRSLDGVLVYIRLFIPQHVTCI
jgi:hypothetical protein